MLNVMESLRDVLAEAHELRPDVIWSDIAQAARRGDNTIRRFEKGQTSPAFSEVDLIVWAYSETLGIPVREIWARAVSRAEANDALDRAGRVAEEIEKGRSASDAAKPRQPKADK